MVLEHSVTSLKLKVKMPYPYCGVGGVLISLSMTVEPVSGETAESTTHGQWDVRPTVTFPAAERHRTLTGITTKLDCLVNR